MEIELPVRMEAPLTAEEKRDMHDYRIAIDDFDEEEYIQTLGKYYYVPLSIRMDDIHPYRQFDDEHTLIKTSGGEGYVVKLDYRSFQALREAMLGIQTKTLEDFHVIYKDPNQA